MVVLLPLPLVISICEISMTLHPPGWLRHVQLFVIHEYALSLNNDQTGRQLTINVNLTHIYMSQLPAMGHAVSTKNPQWPQYLYSE